MGIITILKSWFGFLVDKGKHDKGGNDGKDGKDAKDCKDGKSSKPIVTNEDPRLSTTHIGAGCLFTDGKLVLAGYQPFKEVPCISGLGGTKKEGETVFQTAMRETIEELFEIKDISVVFLEYIKRQLPGKYIRNNNYIFIVYNFKQLERLLMILKNQGKKSYLYTYFPTTLNELLFKREIIHKTDSSHVLPEISHLCLLPAVNHLHTTPLVDNYFITDLQLINDKDVNMISL